MERISKEVVEVTRIGEVDLDEDERALLMLPPKFALRRKLNEVDMRTDIEIGAAKLRYQIHKENSFKEISEEDEISDQKSANNANVCLMKKFKIWRIWKT